MAGDLDIGMKCIKYMLFVSNFMFLMVGFLLISIGTTINAVYHDFEMFMEAHHFKPAELLIAIGIIIFFVSLFGCIGAVRESTMLVNVYAALLFVLLVLEMAAAIAGYVMRADVFSTLGGKMNETLNDYGTSVEAQYSWDFVQERLYCCGVDSPSDWKNKIENGTHIIYNNETFNVPESCCLYQNCQDQQIYDRGCWSRLTLIITDSALMLGIGATCVAFVQLLGGIFASMLAKTIRRVKTEEEMKRQENRQRIYEQLARGQEDKVVTPVLYTPSSSDA